MIDIVVHGRFHAFALAKALIERGHDVLVHTNYPTSVAARFGVQAQHVRSCLGHGIATRVLARLERVLPPALVDPIVHRWFGRWAARSVRAEAHFVYGFTGVMEEFLQTPRAKPDQVRSIVRGSSHIRVQHRLLVEEEERAGTALAKPGDWMIAREEREYALADRIFVLSRFALDSFVEAQPSLASKVLVHPLGVDAGSFIVTQETRSHRRNRILSGAPLKVLTVGTFSYRKGMLDLVEAARRLAGRCAFRFVGDFPSETNRLRVDAEGLVSMSGRVPEAELPAVYAQADVFVFPTIEDGFAAVLLQAVSAGLPVISTPHSSAPDFVIEGRSGWVVPIRDPSAIVERLSWCDANRLALADIADRSGEMALSQSWNAVADAVVSAYSVARARPYMA